MTLNFAHRGFSSRYPENTMLAFKKAVEAGCDGIELDVHLSRDGVPVIIHDMNLESVSGRAGLVCGLTAEELCKIDVSNGYSHDFGFNPVPTLREYFSFISPHKIITNIELKNVSMPYDGLEEKVLALIDEFQLRDRVIISSFNHASVVKTKQLSTNIKSGFLNESCLINPGFYARQNGADFINAYAPTLCDSYINEINANKIGIIAWTVDDEALMERLAAMDIYAIITNKPDVLKKVLERFK